MTHHSLIFVSVSQRDVRQWPRLYQHLPEDGAAAHGNHAEDPHVRNVRNPQVEQQLESQASQPALQSVSPARLCHAECGPDAKRAIRPQQVRG